jgi:hypothetical protein
MLNKIRQIRGFKCDQCGKQMVHGHELILSDKKWIELVKRSKSPYEPRFTLLCPECIELLNGGPLKLSELLTTWHRKGKEIIGAVPMNTWYMREHGMMEKAKPYILSHIRLSPAARDAWSDHGVTEEEVR